MLEKWFGRSAGQQRTGTAEVVRRFTPAVILQLKWCGLYLFTLILGLYFYHRGITFSFGGSSFGSQIGCVALSAVCLLTAAILAATRMDSLVMRQMATEVMAVMTKKQPASTIAQLSHSHSHGHPSPPTPDENHSLLYPSSAQLPTQHTHTTVIQVTENNHTDDSNTEEVKEHAISPSNVCLRLRNWVFVPMPFLIPFIWSFYTFYNPPSPSTALSAQINIILFSSIGAAITLAFGLLYISIVLKRTKQVLLGFTVFLLVFSLYSLLTWQRAQIAYMRGFYLPALTFDPQLKLDSVNDPSFNLLQANPSLARHLEGSLDAIGLREAPRMSLLDSGVEWTRRRQLNKCAIAPHLHLIEVLPYRVANFFTGTNACSYQKQFSSLEWTEVHDKTPADPAMASLTSAPPVTSTLHPLVTIDCPASSTLTFEPLSDFIGARRTSRHSNMARQREEIFVPELIRAQRLEGWTAANERKKTMDLRSPTDSEGRIAISSGPYSYFRLKCGVYENFYLTFVEKPEVTERATLLMKEKLFKEEYAAVAASTPKPESLKTMPTTSPLLLNPPILTIFIDSMSRSQFHRALPLTSALLRKAHMQSPATGASDSSSTTASSTSSVLDGKVIETSDSTFNHDVLNNEDTIFVEFYAPWCGHCKAFAPEYQRAASEINFDGVGARLIALDATVHKALSQKYNIKGYPTVKIFRPGHKDTPDDYTGSRKSADLVANIKTLLAEINAAKTPSDPSAASAIPKPVGKPDTLREKRERLYLLQRARQRLEESVPPASNQTALGEELIYYEKEYKALLHSMPSPDFAMIPRQFSVYESFYYHTLDYHTRDNLKAFFCGSGPSGWGGSLHHYPEEKDEDDEEKKDDKSKMAKELIEQATVKKKPKKPKHALDEFIGGGQPLPPKTQEGSRYFTCEPKDLLWNRLKRSGYVTSLVLDECTDVVNDLFWPMISGGNSTDYEIASTAFCHPEYDNYGEWSNFDGPYSMRRRCIAGKYTHEYSIQYAKEFIQRHDGQRAGTEAIPWFLYLSFIEAHEGSMSILSLIDRALADFLHWVLYSTKTPPIILLMSDHGLHMGPFAEFSQAGQIEHKLPALFTIIPEQWIWYWDVERKKAELRVFEEQSVKLSSRLDFDHLGLNTYYSLHPSPATYHTSFSTEHPTRSSIISNSFGLALHENQFTMVTARELYWFIRHLPDRTVKDTLAQEEYEDEKAWQEGKEKRWREAQLKLKPTTATPTSASGDAKITATSSSDLTYESESLTQLPTSPPTHFRPLSLLSSIPITRTCEQAGVMKELCACGKYLN